MNKNFLEAVKWLGLAVTITITVLMAPACFHEDNNGGTDPPPTEPGWATQASQRQVNPGDVINLTIEWYNQDQGVPTGFTTGTFKISLGSLQPQYSSGGSFTGQFSISSQRDYGYAQFQVPDIDDGEYKIIPIGLGPSQIVPDWPWDARAARGTVVIGETGGGGGVTADINPQPPQVGGPGWSGLPATVTVTLNNVPAVTGNEINEHLHKVFVEYIGSNQAIFRSNIQYLRNTNAGSIQLTFDLMPSASANSSGTSCIPQIRYAESGGTFNVISINGNPSSVTFFPPPSVGGTPLIVGWFEEGASGGGNPTWYGLTTGFLGSRVGLAFSQLNIALAFERHDQTFNHLVMSPETGESLGDMYHRFWNLFGYDYQAGTTRPPAMNVFALRYVQIHWPEIVCPAPGDDEFPLTMDFDRGAGSGNHWASATFMETRNLGRFVDDGTLYHAMEGPDNFPPYEIICFEDLVDEDWEYITLSATLSPIQNVFLGTLVHELAHAYATFRSPDFYYHPTTDRYYDHYDEQHTGLGREECIFRTLAFYPIDDSGTSDFVAGSTVIKHCVTSPHFCQRHVERFRTP